MVSPFDKKIAFYNATIDGQKNTVICQTEDEKRLMELCIKMGTFEPYVHISSVIKEVKK